MSHPFDQLTLDPVSGAVESLGYLSGAQVLALNSYEDRVYQAGIEDGEPLIAKSYRPDHWSDAAIREEHIFSAELAECGVSVITPLSRDGESLLAFAGSRFALSPRRDGRTPKPGNLDQLCRLGQSLGRLHAVGVTWSFEHREALTVDSFGHASLTTLLGGNFIPRGLPSTYEPVARDLLKHFDALFAGVSYQPIRLYGDCHPGNLPCRDEVYHVVNLDDCRMGPTLQGLWMMLAGERHEHLTQVAGLIDGYSKLHDFNPRQLPLLEGLCSLRLVHYSAWLVRRWDDPAFPPSFPWFDSERCWSERVLMPREQLMALDEELLRLF